MSKTTRKTSKASKVLKAAGTAGIFFGAATLDANVVFAAESDSMSFTDSESSEPVNESATETESTFPSESAESSEQASSGEESAAESAGTVESSQDEKEDAGSEKDSASDEQGSESEKDSASDEQGSESEKDSAADEQGSESEKDSASDEQGSGSEQDSATDELDSGSEKGSGESSEDVASASESESVSVSESEAEAASISESESAAASASEEASASVSEFEAESVSASESESAAISTSESASASVSEFEAESASASESESAVISASESVSVSTSESEADSLSALESETAIDKMIAAFVNRSAAMLMAENGDAGNEAGRNPELDKLLQEYKDNLTALEKAKQDENVTPEKLAEYEDAVAQSIVRYEVACKGTNTNVEDLGNGEYRATYVDASGNTVTEFYKKGATDESGNVRVYKANASYVSKDEEGNATKYEIVKEKEETQYIVVTKPDGTSEKKEVLSVTDTNGEISYIVSEVRGEGGFISKREWYVLSKDGKTFTYHSETYDTGKSLTNGGGGTTERDVYWINGQQYDVAGGNDQWNPGILKTAGRYVVVQDAMSLS